LAGIDYGSDNLAVINYYTGDSAGIHQGSGNSVGIGVGINQGSGNSAGIKYGRLGLEGIEEAYLTPMASTTASQ
jgi:hypothetical protein